MRKIGLLGGTFDPVHNGHMALARAAQRRFKLDQVLFIPCGLPPHKSGRGITPFLHRYTMAALACRRVKGFAPSLLEAGPDLTGRRRHYTADTVAALRRKLGRDAKLYFLMGADQFLTLPAWRNFRRLASQCEFIVARRPGCSLTDAREVLPADVLSGRAGGTANTILLRNGAVHLLPMPAVDVSARDLRSRIRLGKRGWRSSVPEAVAEYIAREGLYCFQTGRTGRRG